MLGAAYLCFEATEKIAEALGGRHAAEAVEELALSSAELETVKVKGAIRTDLILSAEIMAIALANVADRPLGIQAATLAIVGLAITVGVYGVVGLIVKMDDIGLHLAERRNAAARRFGRGLVRAMPVALSLLTQVGTAAMLWVGGGIIVHGLEVFGLETIPHWVEGLAGWAGAVPGVGAVTGWAATATASAVVGLVVGGPIVLAAHLLPKRAAKV
jgi:predicted DNA repair protein MutK